MYLQVNMAPLPMCVLDQLLIKKHCLLKNGWAIDRVMAKSYALVYLPSERCKLAEVLFSSDCVSVCVCMQCTDQSDSLGVKC